jgi:hypothetical protein
VARDVLLIRAARACTKFSMRCDGAGMNIFRRRTLARAASLLSDFRTNFTLRVSILRLSKYEHLHLQYLLNLVQVTIIVLMFGFC